MSETDKDAIRRCVREILVEADRDGKLESGYWKASTLRQEVERRLELESGALEEKEYKKLVKDITAATVDEFVKREEEKPKRAKSKTSDGEKGKKPRSKPAPKEKKARKRTAEPGSPKPSKKQRSSSVVPSSDEDMEEDAAPSGSSPKAKRPSKAETKQLVSEKETDAEAAAEPPKKRHKAAIEEPSTSPVASVPPSKEVTPEAEEGGEANMKPADSGYKSESEMSVLIDEPPKRSQKKKKTEDSEAKAKAKKQSKEKKGKQPAKELSKDEETIKRLKSFVVACGVRKAWSKEFKDLDTPSAQIKRLKAILSDLGMTGRFSMEQAKTIRAKRELAKELEDVQNFQKAVVSSSSERARKRGRAQQEDADDSDEEGDVPRRPRTTARQSIMAFLGDQSEED